MKVIVENNINENKQNLKFAKLKLDLDWRHWGGIVVCTQDID